MTMMDAWPGIIDDLLVFGIMVVGAARLGVNFDDDDD